MCNTDETEFLFASAEEMEDFQLFLEVSPIFSQPMDFEDDPWDRDMREIYQNILEELEVNENLQENPIGESKIKLHFYYFF
jgi:hypothetical protein